MNRAQKRRQRNLLKTAAKNEMRRHPTPARGQAEGGVPTYDLQGLIQKGIQVHQAGQLPEAEAIYRQVLDVEPDHADANHLLGVIADQAGRHEIAVLLISKAIKKNPIDAAYHCNLGNALHEQGRLDEAIASYRKALAIKPDYAEAHSNLGNALHEQGRLDDAVASCRKALGIKPDLAGAHSNLGNAFTDLGRLDDAVASYHKALALKPDFPEVHSNLGTALKKLGRFEDAAASYHKALAIEPDFPEAHENLGRLRLMMGSFQDGWEDYAWRWRVKDSPLHPHDYEKPFWGGSDLEGQTIFIYPEQGLGDVVQFVRYLPLVAARGGRVVFEVPPHLVRLFQGIDGADTLLRGGEPLPPFDFHAPLLDLPRLLNTSLETIPSHDFYLKAAPELEEAWASRLGPWEEFRVGIAWAGNPNHKNDRNRSMEPSLLQPLTEIPGVSVYSLQVGRNGEAVRLFSDNITDLAPFLTDFAETAAVMSNLDLVVSVDTSVVHVAGALGRPVWTLLPFIPDWRWLLERDDSPWYPTMRLFRQEKRGDWKGVIERVSQALTDQLENTRN